MPARDWVSFAPVGVGVVVILMLLASGLVNHRNDSGCAFGAVGPDCRRATGQNVVPLLSDAPNAFEDAQRFQRPAEPDQELRSAAPDQGLLWGSPLSLYILGASLVLAVVTLAVVAVIARRQHRSELAAARRAADEDTSVTTDRIIKLVESVATVLRALEERTRELETGLKELGAARTTQGQELTAIAASLEQVRADQIANTETTDRLDRAIASTVEEIGKHQSTLVDNLLPNIARRDERLVAIDANLTVAADRLAKLGSDTERSARETAVLAECFGSLEKSFSELTNGLVELRGSSRDKQERPPENPAALESSKASDPAVGSSGEPTAEADGEASGPDTASRAALSNNDE